MNKKIVYIAIFIFYLTSTLFANNLEKVSVQLNWKYQFEVAGFIAAKEKGFYESVGLDVELREYKSDIDVVYEVLNQKANYGISNSNVVLDKGKVAPIVLLSTYIQKSPLVLLTKPEIKTPFELIGKTIIGTKDDLKYSSLALLFSHFNINSQNSNFISENFKIDDFISGKADAMSAFKSNQIFELDKKGIAYNIIDPADFGFMVSAINLYSSKKEAVENFARTEKFIEATNRGWKYALDNPEEIIDILINKYSVEKSKDALLYEANIVKQLVMSDFIPIGKVSSDLTQRLLKQLVYSSAIDKNENVEHLFFDKNLLKKDIEFYLTKEEKDYLDSKDSIKLCVDPNWYPIEYVKDEHLMGITSDIKKLFESKIDKNLEVVSTKSFAQSLEFIKNRECDIISSVSPNSERESYMNFTEPILKLPIVMATNIDKPFIQNLSLLKNKIAIVKGYFLTDYIKTYFPNIELVEVLSVDEGLKLVEEAKVYGYIDNSLVLTSIIQKEYASSLKIGLRLDKKEDISFGIRNDEPTLEEIFKKLVATLDEVKKQEFLNNWTIITEQIGLFELKEVIIFIVFIGIILFVMFYYHIKLKVLNNELKKISSIDKLTNIFNRYEIDKNLIYEKAKVDRKKEYVSSVILIDIDHFKSINDTFGHLVGDKVLVEIARLLKINLRKIDILGRWGGEEFMIILPFTPKEKARKVAENLRVIIENSDILKKYNRKITASFGVEEITQDKTIYEILLSTDNLLYMAKEAGRNRVF